MKLVFVCGSSIEASNGFFVVAEQTCPSHGASCTKQGDKERA